MYREVQEKYESSQSVSLLPYPLVNQEIDQPILKFFKYRNKSQKSIQRLVA